MIWTRSCVRLSVRFPSPVGFSSNRLLRQRVMLLWWHNDCQVDAGSMVSRGNAQKSQTLKPAWARLRQHSLAKVGKYGALLFGECGNLYMKFTVQKNLCPFVK
ncbi:hypothetical protein Hanom_Chr12g01129851 [Helianthus anomalus]